MEYGKLISMAAAAAITAGGLVFMARPAAGKPPIFVTAPPVNPADIVTRHIGYADLNLASAAGERTLNRRVGGAVNSLCLEVIGGNDTSMESMAAEYHCATSTWTQARPQIAQAVQRARDIASTGSSSLAAAAITLSVPE
jgi:UrcA family protein